MGKYKIAYIDDEKGELLDFQEFMGSDFDTIALLPKADIHEMVEDLFQLNTRAVIVDHLLSVYKKKGKPNIPYDGVDLVEEILSKKALFPCFILTQKETEAIESSKDVNFVYSKRIITTHDEKEKTIFKEKIRTQIEHYLKRIEDGEKELKKLLNKSKSKKLNAKEEERLLELDHFIEQSTNKKSSLPKRLKESTGLKKLDELIKNTSEIISELKKGK
ncbi:MAG: hypothetical protein CMD96_08915 [Gammaproteobacteria bacterium]|nr:hypothetical protein [Gammaproteobacteria bacterium]HJP19228.1 hypothetical protein [Nitrospinota bacterium]|tara:strand:+ start:3141 stop:3794 length:654 start_codon:yes stop_codon:yes gene_type:complete